MHGTRFTLTLVCIRSDWAVSFDWTQSKELSKGLAAGHPIRRDHRITTARRWPSDRAQDKSELEELPPDRAVGFSTRKQVFQAGLQIGF